MAATIKGTYQGNLRNEMTHVQSGNTILTDAPTDNHGKGEAFSPTDLACAALAGCMMTIMGISAQGHKFNIDGTTYEVKKTMSADPRRIGQIDIVFMTFCSMLKLMFPVPEFLMITVFWHMYDTSIFPVPLFCKIRSFVTSRQSHLKLPVPLQVAVKESSFTERAVTLPVPFMTTSFKCGVKMVMVTCALL